jgi:hypothetical protein
MPPTLIDPDQLTKVGFAEAVATVSTTNITLSGFQTLNGYLQVDGDRTFVSGQTDPTEDGIYIARTGAWERAPDSLADGSDDLGSTVFLIEEGTFAGQMWQVTAKRGAGIVGTNALPIQEHTGATTATEVWSEEASFTPGNTTATILNTPTAGTERVYRNGVRQNEGGTEDYTISGTTLTFAKKLKAGDIVQVDYKY